jgi:predicted phage terminase large subunit-like protein
MTANLKISQAQSLYLQSAKRGAIFQGGIGSGKTWVLCLWAVLRCMKGRRVCLVSFSYPTLRDVVLDVLIHVLQAMGYEPDKDYFVNRSDMVVRLWDNEILLRSGDRPDSLRGLNCHDIGIDEAREFPDDSLFLILIGRIRNDETGQWRIATTSAGHNWVWQLSQDKEKVQLIIQNTFSSPFLAQSTKNELRARYTGAFARQELYADICDFGAGVIVPGWFKIVNPPVHAPETKIVRYWDLAVSTKTAADESSGAKCSLEKDRFVIWDIQHGRLAYPDLRRVIVACAQEDGPECIIAVEEAGQQLGFIDDLRTIPELREYKIQAEKPHGDKFNRAIPWASRAEAGWVDMVRGEWNRPFMDQCEQFTANDTHAHDDMIDSVSGAYQFVAVPQRNYSMRTL